MSTTVPSTTTDAGQGASSPTSTSSQSDSNTATLYLFTFLATILILILLSASLVLRSYILRRRYRRHLQQTLTDTGFVDLNRGNLGSQFDPLGIRRPTRRFGPKPILWDIWIHLVDDDAWSSFTPVAVQCLTPSPPAPLSSQPLTTPPPALAPLESQPSFFSHFRLAGSFSRSSRLQQPQPSIGAPALPDAPSPSLSTPTSPSPSSHAEKEDAAVLAICVLVAMPDASAPVHRPVRDFKGKGVDPPQSQVPQSGNDADPLLSSSPLPLSPPGARLSDMVLEKEGLPLLEFGVTEVKTDVYR